MKAFVEYLLTQFVSKPDEVRVEESTNDFGLKLTVYVSPDDMGIVIGKEGKNIRSLRNLVKAKAIKDDVRVNLELAEINAQI